MNDFQKKWLEYENEYLNDLKNLIAIPSIRNLGSKCENAPFGMEIRKVFDAFLSIAKRFGFETNDYNGYACDIRYGKPKNKYIGVLGHLDIVGQGNENEWKTNPFELHIDENQILYARGVNDDKAPLLACLYVLRIMKEFNILGDYSIRIIAGGAEETTWECMKHYFSIEPQPEMGFSPDGNFPIVNGEKGICQYTILFPKGDIENDLPTIKKISCTTLKSYVCDDVTIQIDDNIFDYKGIKSLSRNPHRGKDALKELALNLYKTKFSQSEWNCCFKFFVDCLCSDTNGSALGIYANDYYMGETSICPTGLEQTEDGVILYLDIRYPKATTQQIIDNQMRLLSNIYNFNIIETDTKPLLYVEPEHYLIKTLSKAYQDVTGDKAECITKSGASYARTLSCAIAFGATFPDEQTNPHMPNECMSLETIRKASEIYYNALCNLIKK